MLLVFGTGFDPFRDGLDFLLCKWMSCFCGRHLQASTSECDPLNNATCERVAWDDGREATCGRLESSRRIETQAGFTRSIIWAVTGKALGRQDWKHIGAVADTLGNCQPARCTTDLRPGGWLGDGDGGRPGGEEECQPDGSVACKQLHATLHSVCSGICNHDFAAADIRHVCATNF